jgi:hypothetical protein
VRRQRQASPYPVACELLGDVRLESLRVGDVAVAADAVAAPDSGDAAAVERGRQLRIDPQRGVVVGNGVAELPGFQVAIPRLSNASA